MIKTIFMGTPDFAVPTLEVLLKNTELLLVVTQPDKELGRKKILTPSPVKVKALENNIPVFQPPKIRTDFEEILKYQPDLIVTCAYGQIIPEEILNLPPLGCINVHASLLPKYRGGAPIEHAIMNGDTETGVTIMYMDTTMDTGDIIVSSQIPIAKDDNNSTMHAKLSELGAKTLEKILPNIIAKTAPRIKQNNELATYAKIIKREDEHLDFTKKAEEIFNQVRALNATPLANFKLDGEEIKVLEGYVGATTNKEAGLIVDVTKDALGIACQDKVFYITKLKPSGKKEMLTKDYLNGQNKEQLLNKKVE